MAQAAVAADRQRLAAPAARHPAVLRARQARRIVIEIAIAMRRQAARRAARRVQQMAPTSAAHYRRTATTARRPVPALATVQTSARFSAWGDREEAPERREFLVPEPSPASAVRSEERRVGKECR